MAQTRDEALALVIGRLAADRPGVRFAVKEELRGGGLNGPFVFAMEPAAGPFLVEVGSSEVVVLKSMATTRLSVNDWELKKYGVLQR
ncbi:MAG: hypothetical protein QM831_05940 [Kofleriaceae bacterium]